MRWTVLYDGACPLCRRSADAVRRWDRHEACDLVDGTDPAAARRTAPAVAPQELQKALHVLRSDGALFRGFDAVRELLRLHPLGRWLRPLLYIPGAPWLGRRLYSAVARLRHRTRPPSDPASPGHRRSSKET